MPAKTTTPATQTQRRVTNEQTKAKAAAVMAVGGAGLVFAAQARRLWPIYWAAAELLTVVVAGWLGLRWTTVALAAVLVVALAGVWRARSFPVRLYRLVVTSVFALFAVATVAAGPGAFGHHPTWTLFGPTLAAFLLGWPWWYELRGRTKAEPAPDLSLTAYWAQRWHNEVVAENVCAGTRLTEAHRPRAGVIEATIRLRPGAKPNEIMSSSQKVEVCLDLREGAVGWRSTGWAAKVRVIVVEESYIADGVKWRGVSYNRGRCEITTFADGSPGYWTFLRAGFGTLNGLMVGSTGTGKSRALGVLIENLLNAGWMVAVGDPQNGQSLPDWRDAVGEYHDDAAGTTALLRRTFAEVMRRSEMLSKVRVKAFDPDDPRVQALGLRPLAVIVDECQLVLLARDREFVEMVKNTAATCRKTGVSLILATQLPQMGSLGNSVPLRDALIAGNALILRLSNRGSGTSILPDDFVGDPFALAQEINGVSTAGMGYLRHANQVGMLSRVPMLDEEAAAARHVAEPIEWLVPAAAAIAVVDTTAAPSAGGAGSRLRAVLGLGTPSSREPAGPVSPQVWVVETLRKTPMSAQALLLAKGCPVNKSQLYDVLNDLVEAGRIVKPERRGEPFRVA